MLTNLNPVNGNTFGYTPFGGGPIGNVPNGFFQPVVNSLPFGGFNNPLTTPFGFGGLPFGGYPSPVNWSVPFPGSQGPINQNPFCGPQSCSPFGGQAISPFQTTPFTQNFMTPNAFPGSPVNGVLPGLDQGLPFQGFPVNNPMNTFQTPFFQNLVSGFNTVPTPFPGQGGFNSPMNTPFPGQGFNTPMNTPFPGQSFNSPMNTPFTPSFGTGFSQVVPPQFISPINGGFNPGAQQVVPNGVFNTQQTPNVNWGQNWTPFMSQTPFGVGAPNAIGQINPFQPIPGGQQNYKVEKDGTVTVTTQISPNSQVAPGVPVGHREAA